MTEKLFTYLFLLGLICMLSCNQASRQERIATETPKVVEPVTLMDKVYADAVADSMTLKFNMAIPGGQKGPYPLIIFIHGGGWKEGQRSAYNGEIVAAARKGFVAVTISHRLTAEKGTNGKPLYPWPAAIHDCKAAIRFFRENAKKYHINPERIGITGASSGGHLALMAGMTDPSDGLEGYSENGTSSKVQAVVNISGATEMISCYEAPIVTPYLNSFLGSPQENPDGYRQASPVHYVSSSDATIMTLHGSKDEVVPVSQAYQLDSALKAKGILHELNILPEQKHVFQGEEAERSWELLFDFFKRKLGANPS